MKHRYTFLALLMPVTAGLHAQSYCSPSFDNGCFSWNISAVTAGSINWTPGADACSVSDYTSLSTTVNAGESLALSVTDGAWCGCAVWVDLDNSWSFEDSENLYYFYANMAATHTYNFSIDIPSNVPTGAYRMRIVGPWGSNGFTPGSQNGSGPCGDYQYGTFKDFTLNVVGTTGVNGIAVSHVFTLAPNPANDVITISAGSTIEGLTVIDAQGRVVEQQQVQGDRITLDTRAWATGMYLARINNGVRELTQRFMVE